MIVSPFSDATAVQTALDALGVPDGIIAMDTVPLLQQAVILAANLIS